ncbi:MULTISPECIES: winged helix-turn-helix domain-containing protein [Rhizobium]|uniref:winged helix-turn-helix domain-containing protein n=1 Tax=Rhizobium TaxID=379 RepID=UPI0013F17228|nr:MULTISPECIES: winged helix-turn-helix domain-containing protein [Rhizobium]MBB3520918.1 DNA-binding winged helix-turn-helix (wHTH) protein [Rhizobium sp. BK456]MBY4591703.1 winged helix-turn-helix domain-containing protein [Rhizobium redzepovicii]MBY4613234.1 winged helix-turn-helix domain-containing protein [Rhizobium redzepovicii]MDF0657946.1 winged helix-turn-helix domain-containing protein [Rhizobium sp. BC49]ULJ77075.1 winged helix-turn-helix domain-containing protein [Rhizobium sp. C1
MTDLFTFADVTLDPERGRLMRRGMDVDIGAKPLAMLTYLVQNEGRVVSKDELMQAVWPGVIVTEDSLTQAISQIRKAIGADGLIRTLFRRGYLFENKQSAANAMPEKAFVRTLPLAVAPFRLIGPGSDAAWFAEAFSTEVASRLARYHDLEVTWLPEKAVPSPLRATLGFDLNGMVQSVDGMMKVTAVLTEMSSGRIVWSASWDGAIANALEIQSEIAEGIVNALAGHGVLLNVAAEHLHRRAAADRDAFELYLRGRYHTNRFNREDAEKALHCFQRATEIDPLFSRAWLGLAWSHDELASFGVDMTENDAAALNSARRAVELDPFDAEALVALGEMLGNMGQMEAAEAALDRALGLGPSNADVLAMFSGWAPVFGRIEEGIAAAEKARRLNPSWPIWYDSSFRRASFHAGRYEEALSFVLRRQPNTRSMDDLVTAACCAVAVGRPEEAAGWRDQAMLIGYKSASQYLDHAGVKRPEQRAHILDLLKSARFPVLPGEA